MPADDLTIAELLASLCDETISTEEMQRLDRLILADAEARRQYLEYLDLHARLSFSFHRPAEPSGEERGARGEERGMAGSPAIDGEAGFGVRGSGFGIQSSGSLSAGAAVELPSGQWPQTPNPEPPFPVLSTTNYPLPADPFVGSWAFSCMVSAVIMGIAILGAWAYKITYHQHIAKAPAQLAPSDVRQEMVFVGRITGMVDCKWSDPSTEPFFGAYVPLGRKYALASGLIEITYDSGAKAILQGPCTYEVESTAGGYLALGKLTAKVEKKRSEVRGQRSDPSPLSPLPSPLFSVRTPTAIVTDLGTEFGVEVSDKGNTTSHVFRGSVKVQVVGGDGPQKDVVLRENESAQVVKVDGKPSITRCAVSEASGFVLEMPPPKAVRDSQTYAELVLSLNPAVYYRMERPKKGTGPIGAKHPPGRSGQLDLSPFSVVFDSAPGGRHGELRLGNEFGGAPYLSGRFGDSLNFRGPEVGDHAIVPDYPKAADNRLTVSAWVVATSRPGWAMIAANWGHPQEGTHLTGQFLLGLFDHDGDLTARVTQRDGQFVEAREGVSRPFPMFVWQHVALVADGAILHLHRNGEEVASVPYTDIIPRPPMASLGIGCKTNNAGTEAVSRDSGDSYGWQRMFQWQGRIDELAVFDRALSAEAIRQLYLGQLAGGTGVSPVQELGRDTVGSTGETPVPPVRKEGRLME